MEGLRFPDNLYGTEKNISKIETEVCLGVIHLKGFLLLEDGSIFQGLRYGSESESYGEVVFTTSMTGYVESVTDPSYRRQILVFAEPTVANYPVNRSHMESEMVNVAGVVTRDIHIGNSETFGSDFSGLLSEFGIPGIDGVDTRSLILKIRRKGVMKGYILNEKRDLYQWPDPLEGDVVSEVVTEDRHAEYEGRSGPKILNINLGEKNSVLSSLRNDFNLKTVNHRCNFNELEDDYDAIFVSNGPGDPATPHLESVVSFIRKNISSVPILGICLGHQLISLAYGLKTVKMHFGHRGSNHAVTDGNRVWITTHNHGFAVVNSSNTPLHTRMWDVNDHTVEMLESKKDRVFCVQFHPEASPGPLDAKGVFSVFSRIVKEGWFE